METAKIFNNGGSQAVRLPKDCRFEESDVYVVKIGSVVILSPKNNDWEDFFNGVRLLSDDFMKDYSDLPVEDMQ